MDLSVAGGESETLLVAQRESEHAVVERSTLPSFLSLPTARERSQMPGGAFGLQEGWVVGLMAQRQASIAPERVAHSAKSWLAHHAVSPNAKILPWNSSAIGSEDKLSAIDASAFFLSHLREAWDERFGRERETARFVRQAITITVPASFDAASQKATLEAAERAGFPESVRLLEEPQAAFYRWLEGHQAEGERGALAVGACILVVDVGGGTSDFSLFRVKEAPDEEQPVFERVAVSKHILLGGDNIDLALAHALESELSPEGEELSGEQWSHLIARARGLKERCLSGAGEGVEMLNVSLPGRGSSLLAGTLSAQVSSADARELLLEGFFPPCDRADRPEKPTVGLQEWGLPYAPDFAVTRYLADFLRDQPPVDAVLFNGGTLAAPLLRERLLEQLAAWQEGKAPVVLRNPETDLSVARGAACFGALTVRDEQRIEAGAARSVYLRVATASGDDSAVLVCVLPRGARPNEPFRIEVPGLQLTINHVSQFQAYQATSQRWDAAGELVAQAEEEFLQLPPLQALASLDPEKAAARKTVPVWLESELNELGLLQVACVSGEAGLEGRWPLDFDLRAASGELDEEGIAPPAARAVITDPGVSSRRIQQAKAALRGALAGSSGKNRKLTAARVLRELERVLELPKHEWNLLLLRALVEELLEHPGERKRSLEHAETWRYLVGYLLRPGFGDPLDRQRIETLWQLLPPDASATLSTRVELQELILWRRLAGGLSSDQQRSLFDLHWRLCRQPKGATAERVRLLGALEKVPVEQKQAATLYLLERAKAEMEAGGYPAPYLASLGRVLSRAPFQAGPEYVAPPSLVVAVFDELERFDWRQEKNAEAIPLFLSAARIVDERGLNLPSRAQKKVVNKLRKSGVADTRLAPLRDYVPITRAEQVSAYGEALPAGLTIGG